MATQHTHPLFTSNSNLAPWRRFCRHVGMFFAPLLVLCVLFEVAMWRTGESWPIWHAVRTQLSLGATPSLYVRAVFSQQLNLYKYAMLKHVSPAIVIHGTSRVMQIRDLMFHPLEPRFYNAGGMVQSPQDMMTYAQRIHSGDLPTPEVVIVGIDPWWVKEGDSHNGWLDDQSLQDDVLLLPAHVEAARRLLRHGVFPWEAILTGVPSPSPGYGYQAIGAKPLLDGEGFRRDGSLQLGPDMVRDSVHNPHYTDRAQILQMVTEYREFYARPVRFDHQRANLLLEALTALQHMGIEVYAFLPPFASVVQTVFETSPDWQPFWRAYHLGLPAHLRAAGITCLPLSVPRQDGFDDQYMYDGHHPSEIYAAAQVKKILLQAPSHSLLRQVDIGSLDTILSRSYPTPLSFDLPPPQVKPQQS